MYLSSLQKFILKKALENINNESLSLNSDAIETFIIKSRKNQSNDFKKKMLTASINEFLEIKKKIEKVQIKYSVTNFGVIEPDSNNSAHIYFYEPIIKFYNIKAKEHLLKMEESIYNSIGEYRKSFEIKKRKYERKDGNHKRGVIRGESKNLKKAKASVSRCFSTLIKKKYFRKIPILNYDNNEIGIGYNLSKLGKSIIVKYLKKKIEI